MRTALSLLICLVAPAIPAAWANGGGGMSTQQMPSMPRTETPQQKARTAYNDGVRLVKKADKAGEAALSATDAGKKDKAAREAHDEYGAALEKFKEAVGLDATLPEAWNYVGYTSRKLGSYDDALAAYGKALALKPGYPDALEYRGEAYLGVSRLADAQQTYLDLYAGNRALAAKLLAAMKQWVATQRASPSGATPSPPGPSLDDLDKWIQERAQIAGQTAALTRAGTAAAWR
jgi:tetratricopeptide (TPR) repeat protein